MYGPEHFKKDWRWLLIAAVAGSPVVLLILQLTGDISLLRLWHSYKPSLVWFAGALAFAVFMLVLAVRSVMVIEHKGWQRLLILAALACIVYPFFSGTDQRTVPLSEVIVDLVAVGLYRAVIVIFASQIIAGVLLWIYRGFAGFRNRREG